MEYMSSKGFHYVSLIHVEVCYNEGRSAGVTPRNEAPTSGAAPGNKTLNPGVIPFKSDKNKSPIYLLYNCYNAVKEYIHPNIDKEVIDYLLLH